MSAGHLLILSLKGLQETLVLPVDHITFDHCDTDEGSWLRGSLPGSLTFSPFIRHYFRRIFLTRILLW